MKKAAAVCLLVLGAFLLYGCAGRAAGKKSWPESSSIYVSRDGSVSSALVETYENGTYDEAGLKAFLDGAAARYTEEHPGQGETPAVSLKECSAEDGRMTAVFSYASPEDMIAFGKEQQDDSMGLISLKVMAATEAFSQETDGAFTDRKGQTADLASVAKEKKAIAVVAEGEGLIQTEGTILYVSQGTELDSEKNQARVTGAKSYIIFR